MIHQILSSSRALSLARRGSYYRATKRGGNLGKADHLVVAAALFAFAKIIDRYY
jgi:hypothetical protein